MYKKSEIVTLQDGRTIISNEGDYPTSVFKERFSPDRYGGDATKRAREYGKSMFGTTIDIEGTEYKIIGCELMFGSVGYVGSTLFLIEKVK